MIKVFLSYSHHDEDLRDELETHLSTLKRQNVIEVWHDRRLVAGDEFDGKISDNLEEADLILLLVSANFLNSDYCHDKEMLRALERHEAGEARVIPVILHPCDWKHAPFGKLLAAPTDGTAVSKHSNQHDAFLDIVTEIREAAAALSPSTDEPTPAPKTTPTKSTGSAPRTSNLRVKKDFSDHEHAQFRNETFEYIANYFENSLVELKLRNPGLEHMFERVDAKTFTAAIYASGKRVSGCRITKGGSFGDIAYSMDETARDNSCHDWLAIEHDGYTPLLHTSPMRSMGEKSESGLTQEGAAEHFWSILIEPCQRR